MATAKYTLGVIDEEKAERSRLHNYFEDAFNVIEIKSFKDIDKLVAYVKSEGIDALAIDYRLKEHGDSKFDVNGDTIFKELINSLKGFPAFILTNDSLRAKKESKSINSFFIIDKDKTHLTNATQRKDFFREINTNIKLYKDAIAKKMKRLKTLNNKRGRGELSAIEENEFLELNNELSKSFTGKTMIPLKYFSVETNKKLDQLLKKTDALIKKIKK